MILCLSWVVTDGALADDCSSCGFSSYDSDEKELSGGTWISQVIEITDYEGKLKYSSNLEYDKLDIELNYNTTQPKLTLYKWERESRLELLLGTQLTSKTKESDEYTFNQGTNEMKFYPINDSSFEGGGFEWEIILTSIPKSNIFTYSIDSTNLDFYYQPPLDEEHNNFTNCNETNCWNETGTIYENRPIDVVGSYAVYHSSKSNNEYRTGKAFHIYRPKVIDAEGKWIWGELNITDNKLILSVDSEWLSKAKYPVIVDPTIGYTGAGSSYFSGANNYFFGFIDSADTTGTIKNVSVSNDGGFGANEGCFRGVLTDSSGNIVSNGVGNYVQGSSSKAWTTATYSSYPEISQGTTYWVGIVIGASLGVCGTNGADFAIYRDTGSGTNTMYDTSNSFTSPTNPTDASGSTYRYSIYMSYDEPAAPPAFTVTSNSPDSNYNTTDTTPTHNFTVSGSEATYSCTLYYNTTSKGTNASVINNTPTLITASSTSTGVYQWNVTCTSGATTNSSAMRNLRIAECIDENDCDTCEKCTSFVCGNQANTEDLKGECGTTNCFTGNCSGTGATCGVYSDDLEHSCGASCLYCHDGTADGSCDNMPNNAEDSEGGNTCTGTCVACQSGSCSIADADSDPDDDCTAINCYTGDCNGTTAACKIYDGGEEGTCDTCFECNDADSDCDYIAAHNQDSTGSNLCNTTCVECNGTGNCTNQLEDQDYFSQCGIVQCDGDAATPYYYGFNDTYTCLYRLDVSAEDAKCDGGGACKDDTDYCESQGADGDSGVTCSCADAQVGCTGTTIGSCDNGVCAQNYSRNISQAISLAQALENINKMIRLGSDSLTVDAELDKSMQSVRNAYLSISLTDKQVRELTQGRSITTDITITLVNKKGQGLEVTQTITITPELYREIGINRIGTTEIQLNYELYSILTGTRSLSDGISFSDALFKSLLFERIINEPFALSLTTDRIISYERETDFLITVTPEMQREISSGRNAEVSITQSFLLKKGQGLPITTEITVTPEIARIIGLDRSSSVLVTFTSDLQRLILSERMVSDDLEYSDSIERILVVSRSLETGITGSYALSQLSGAIKFLSDSISLAFGIERSSELSRIAETPISVSLSVFRELAQDREIDITLSISPDVQRTLDRTKSVEVELTYLLEVKKGQGLPISTTITISSEIARSIGLDRNPEVSLSVGDEFFRILEQSRESVQELIFSGIPSQGIGFSRGASDGISLSAVISRSIGFSKSVSDSLTINTFLQRMASLFRGLSLPINLYSMVDVLDTFPPTFSDNSTNSTYAGESVLHSVKITDDNELDGYIFSFCNGTWNGSDCSSFTTQTLILQDPDTENLADMTISDIVTGVLYGGVFKFNTSGITDNEQVTISSGLFYFYINDSDGLVRESFISGFELDWDESSDSSLFDNYPIVNRTQTQWNGSSKGWVTENITEILSLMVTENTSLLLERADELGEFITNGTHINNIAGVLAKDTDYLMVGEPYKCNVTTKESSVTEFRPYLNITYSVGGEDWVNSSFTALTGTEDWANETRTINSTVGANIARKVWANDSLGNGGWSDTYSYVTTLHKDDYVRSLSDSLSLSAVANKLTSLFRSDSETLSLSLALSRVGTISREITDPVNIIALFERITGLFRSLSLPFGLSFDFVSLFSGNRYLSEDITIEAGVVKSISIERDTQAAIIISDEVQKQMALERESSVEATLIIQLDRQKGAYTTITVPISLSLELAKELGLDRYSTLLFTISPDITRSVDFERLLSSDLTISDELIKQMISNREFSDSISLDSVLVSILGMKRSASDGISINLATERSTGLARNIQEGLVFSSDVDKAINVLRTAEDVFTISPEVLKLRGINRDATLAISLSDEAKRTLQAGRNAEVTITLLIEVVRGSNQYYLITQQITITPELAKELELYRNLDVSISEVLSAGSIKGIERNLAFTITITPEQYYDLDLSRLLSEDMTITSEVLRSIINSRYTTQSISLSSSVDRIYGVSRNLYDSIILVITGQVRSSSSGHLITNYVRDISERITLSVRGSFSLSHTGSTTHDYVRSISDNIGTIWNVVSSYLGYTPPVSPGGGGGSSSDEEYEFDCGNGICEIGESPSTCPEDCIVEYIPEFDDLDLRGKAEYLLYAKVYESPTGMIKLFFWEILLSLALFFLLCFRFSLSKLEEMGHKINIESGYLWLAGLVVVLLFFTFNSGDIITIAGMLFGSLSSVYLATPQGTITLYNYQILIVLGFSLLATAYYLRKKLIDHATKAYNSVSNIPQNY